MTTLGDVWAVTALVVGISICAWALLLCIAVLFPGRASQARDRVEAHPWRAFLVGLLVAIVTVGSGLVLLSSPLQALKLVGWFLVLGTTALSFAGTAGLVLLAAERIRNLDASMSAYGAVSRGAIVVILSCVLPFLGWFLFAPAIFAIGLGASLGAQRARAPVQAGD